MLPPWLLPTSSPARISGTPCASSRDARKLRRSWRRSAKILGIVGRSFDAAIRAVVVVRSVAIVFAVGLVVLVLVADEIGEREAIMHGDVVDARARLRPS